MTAFCQDRDILCLEPLVYLSAGFAHQQPASGTDGQLNGTTFTSTSADFTTAGITPGMVLVTYHTSPAEGLAWEIVEVTSATMLKVSVLRATVNDPAIAPPNGTGLSYNVRSFASQIALVSAGLGEKLRHVSEAVGIVAAEFADSHQLAMTCALGVLARIYTARAENARPHDANWIKAERFREEFIDARNELRLAVDADGDGVAEQTRSLGQCTLRRV